MKRRDLVKLLEKNGFKEIRTRNHTTYFKEGIGNIEVPHHREINELTAKTILKQAGL